jgi:predicted ArsR family transcriptional regulator
MNIHQPDLFSAKREVYPATPGFKAEGTSRAAAEAMKPRALTLREQVLSLLKSAALTADECAARLEKTVLAVRPRLSELSRIGSIEDTGRTRRNESGVQATVWRASAKT